MSSNSQRGVVSCDLSPSALAVQRKRDVQVDKAEGRDQKKVDWAEVHGLEERLRREREERSKLELEMQKLREEREEAAEEQEEQETGSPVSRSGRGNSDHTLVTFMSVWGQCRCFCDDKKEARTSGNGGSSVQGAGLLPAGEAGLCHQG